MVPVTGAAGVTGCAFITIWAEAIEVHVAAFVTVYVYVPEASPEIVVVVPVPVVTVPPGDRVRVQVPAAGRPLSATLPVASAQVGWVIVPTTGAEGVTGCALIVKSAEATEVQVDAFVTVKE